MIDAETKLYGIIGDPVSHSKSPHMHNAAFDFRSINAVYLAFNIKKEKLADALSGLKNITELKGFNVTVPHKTAVMEYLDAVDDVASVIGSVNTVKNENGLWKGYNTDYYGVVKTLENNGLDNNAKVLVIGAGGASPAVIYALQEYGFKQIDIVNRTESTAAELSAKFNIGLISFNDYREKSSDYGFIINTTTLSFSELLDNFYDDAVYFDLKYYKEAGTLIKKYIDGKDMLLYQACLSHKVWFDREAPADIMRNALK